MFFGDVKVNGKKVAETEYGYLGIIRRMGEGEIVLAATDAKTGASVSCKLWPASAD